LIHKKENIDNFCFVVANLHENQSESALNSLPSNLGHWVKPQSTTWFSRFLMVENNYECWVENFKMTKDKLFTLLNV
jgi:hypothetical protein